MAGEQDSSPPSFLWPSISDIVKRKRIRSKAGWGEACSRKVREDPRAARRRVIILSLEQPVVGLEPDRSDPRMRLKQNWSFQAKTCVVERFPKSIDTQDARFGDESNQVS
jgi:hypothetical protein